MKAYLLRRIALMIPTLFGITIVVFAAVRFLPGDVVDQIIGPDVTYVNPQTRAAIEQQYGLDQPIVKQYLWWIEDLAQGNFGRSIISGRPVLQDLGERIPVTIELGLLGLIFSLVIALPVGVIAAVRQDGWADQIARSAAILFLAIPSFWLALIVIIYGFNWFGWTPPLRYHQLWESPSANIRILWIPGLILGAHTAGAIMRLMRTTMLEVLRQDYIRTGWSKGLRERTVITRHALRNAVIPVITIIGLEIRGLVGGTVILEAIFSIPGMGNFLLSSIQQRDYPVVQAVVLLTAVIVVISNLVVDISYSLIDPRIRYSS